MDNAQLVSQIISKSNYNEISSSISDFVKTYINKLISDITLYVDSNISIKKISTVDSYTAKHELSQRITGLPSAYSAIDGEEDILVQFAEAYARLGIKTFDELAKEALVDFLNLHNGLFVVLLSKLDICELSLSAPVQANEISLKSTIHGAITIIEIQFTFGIVKFMLLETEK